MGMTTISSVSEPAPKASALENAAKVLGIVGTLGSLASNATDTYTKLSGMPKAPVPPPMDPNLGLGK